MIGFIKTFLSILWGIIEVYGIVIWNFIKLPFVCIPLLILLATKIAFSIIKRCVKR